MEDLKWKEAGIDALKIAFDEGEKMLKETIVTANYQVDRVKSILRPVIGSIIVLIAYLLSEESRWGILYIEGFVFLVMLMLILIVSFFAYKTYNIEPTGNNPFNVLTNDAIKYGGDNLIEFLIYRRCITIEEAINTNLERNAKRLDIIATAEILIFSTPIILIAIALVYLLSLLWS